MDELMLQERKKRKCPKGYVKEQIEKSRLETTTIRSSQEQALETRAAELTQNGAPSLQEISPKDREQERHISEPRLIFMFLWTSTHSTHSQLPFRTHSML